MSISRRVLPCILSAGLALVGACAGNSHDQRAPDQPQGATESKPPSASFTITVSGPGVRRPTTLTFEHLARMEMVRLDEVTMMTSDAPDRSTSWRGPSLEALLAAAEVQPGPMIITFEAADGYAIDCRSTDLRSAIVALQDGDGRWLAERDEGCHLRLVVPGKPGNHWVRNVSRITVAPAGDEP